MGTAYNSNIGSVVTNGVRSARPDVSSAELAVLDGITATVSDLNLTTTRADYSGETASAADSLAIPITAPLCLKTTGADAEALTIADGTFIGQTIAIQLDVDGGGDGTLTPATSTSFGTIVFADAGDLAILLWAGATTGWILQATADLAGVGGPVYTLA